MIASDDEDADVRVWKNVPAGTILPTRPRRILVATTATDILLMY
jgi:hypothetical protein